MKSGLLVKIMLIIALPAICYWGSLNLISPLEAENNQLSANLNSLRRQKRTLQNRIAANLDEEKKLSELVAQVERIIPVIPAKQEITRLIARLPTLSQKSQVLIKEVRYAPFSDINHKYQLLEFTMPVIGGYSNIREFIFELEKMPAKVAIDSLSLKQHKNKGVQTLELALSAIYQKP